MFEIGMGALGGIGGASGFFWWLLKRQFERLNRLHERLDGIEKKIDRLEDTQMLLINTLKLTFPKFKEAWDNNKNDAKG